MSVGRGFGEEIRTLQRRSQRSKIRSSLLTRDALSVRTYLGSRRVPTSAMSQPVPTRPPHLGKRSANISHYVNDSAHRYGCSVPSFNKSGESVSHSGHLADLLRDRGDPVVSQVRRALTRVATRAAASCGSSCSHTRMTSQPASRRR